MKKYKVVYEITRVNELQEEYGYKLHTAFTENIDGLCSTKYIMSLSSEKAYDNISNLIDIPPNQVDEYLAKGWIVADSWSKLIRMVKKQ